MEIDLKDPDALTLKAVKRLLASKDDSKHRQLRVTKNGIAFLSDEVGARNIHGLACRFETWDPGNGYCGKEAASSKEWVQKVYEDLKENWPEPKDTYIDY